MILLQTVELTLILQLSRGEMKNKTIRKGATIVEPISGQDGCFQI